MKESILNGQERVTAEKYLAKLEKKAISSRMNRYIMLPITLGLAVLLFFNIYSSKISSPRDHSLEEILSTVQYRSDVEPQVWMVAELTRIASIIDSESERQRLQSHVYMINEGLLLVILYLFINVLLHWNDHKRDRIIAKVLRVKWDEFTTRTVDDPT
ncbi:hypothetical protein EH220_00400 [bacterium]|nr:MAG: hypothetical protein EH220_00400 [bacterium]